MYGIGYLSEDRKRYGLTLGMDVKENIAMASMKNFLRWFSLVDFKKRPPGPGRWLMH